MNNYASAMLIAGLVLIGVAPSTGTDPVVAYAPHVSAAAVPEGPLDETLNEVVQQYCVRCHSDRRMTGNMSLEGFDIGNPMTEAELAA